MNNTLVQIEHLEKKYGNQFRALNQISLQLPQTGLIFIKGNSGCGKTTFLNILGGLDQSSEGTVRVNGNLINNLSGSEGDLYRNCMIAFVFQDYNLIEGLTAGENIALALSIQDTKSSKTSCQKNIEQYLAYVGLEDFADRQIQAMSGGQKQRVAIARAIAKNSKMILADEPTGNLDTENSNRIFKLFREISAERLVVIVTHDDKAAYTFGDRVITLSDGKVIADEVLT